MKNIYMGISFQRLILLNMCMDMYFHISIGLTPGVLPSQCEIMSIGEDCDKVQALAYTYLLLYKV